MAGDPEPEDRRDHEPREEERGRKKGHDPDADRDEPRAERRALSLTDRAGAGVGEAEDRRDGEQDEDAGHERAVDDELVDRRDGDPERERRQEVRLVELDRLGDDLADRARHGRQGRRGLGRRRIPGPRHVATVPVVRLRGASRSASHRRTAAAARSPSSTHVGASDGIRRADVSEAAAIAAARAR